MNKSTQRLLLSLLLLGITACAAQSKNGFDLTASLVPTNTILSGGPAKEGIPAIDNPRFVEAGQADFLQADTWVLGLNYRGIAKAYPITVLNWHEIVNDRFGDASVVITFCPLCGSGMAFLATLEGKAHTFGVSGLLYNNNVLLYDRQTESLWSQLMSQAITGPYKGMRLNPLPVLHTTWQDWRDRHPDTVVLSTDTGFRRDYDHSPYETYLKSPQIMFPVTATSRRYHPKEEVLGITIDGAAKAYPFVELEQGPASFVDHVGGKPLIIRYDHRHRSAEALDEEGVPMPGVRTFWFAWYAFNPNTAIYMTKNPQ